MASRSLGTLTLDLIAQVGGFIKGMDKAERASDKWRKKVKSDLKKANVAIGNFATGSVKLMATAAGGVAALVASTAKAAKETQDLSKVANTGVQDFQRFTFASKRFGVEQEKVADILKDVNDKVGDFLQTGGGPLKDFFEQIAPQVGVTAEQFRNLSGDQALQLYVDSLEKANVSQSDMIFFMEAIASDSTKLIPLLKNGGEELKKLGDEGERTGNVLGEVDFSKLLEAEREIQKLQDVFTGLKNEIVIAALPAVEDLIGTLNDPQVRAGLKDLAESFVKLTTASAKGAAKVGEFFAAVNFLFNRDYDLNNIVDVNDLLDDLNDKRKDLESVNNNPLFVSDATIKELEETKRSIKGLERLRANFNKTGFTGYSGSSKIQFEKISQEQLRRALGLDALDDLDPIKVGIDGKAFDQGSKKGDLFGFDSDSDHLKGLEGDLKKYAKQQETARKEAERLSKSIADQVAQWEKQAETVGFTNEELAIFNLEQMGANQAQIEAVKIAQDAIKSFEEKKQAQEDYQSLLQSLRTDEEVLTDQLKERLEILEKMAQVSGEALNEDALKRIINGSFEDSDDVGNITNDEGIAEARKELEDWYSEQLDLLDSFRQERADLNAEWDEKEAELKQEHQERLNEIESEAEQIRQERIMNGYSALLDVMGAYFDGMEGKEAAYARAAIQIGKTLLDEKKRDALVSLWTDTHSAAMGAYNAMASIPYVGPVLGAAAAGAVYVAGGTAAAGILGLAHDGMDSIPQTGTWYLEKGERVTTEKTSAKLDATLDNVINSLDTGTTNNRNSTVNQTINVQGRPDRRTAKQIAQEAAKKQRLSAAMAG